MEKSLPEDTMQDCIFFLDNVWQQMCYYTCWQAFLQILEEEIVLYFFGFGEISVNVEGRPGAGVLHCDLTLSAKA